MLPRMIKSDGITARAQVRTLARDAEHPNTGRLVAEELGVTGLQAGEAIRELVDNSRYSCLTGVASANRILLTH